MRVVGRKSADGTAYEIVQGETVIQSTPIEDAKNDRKLAAAIKRNGWGPVE